MQSDAYKPFKLGLAASIAFFWGMCSSGGRVGAHRQL